MAMLAPTVLPGGAAPKPQRVNIKLLEYDIRRNPDFVARAGHLQGEELGIETRVRRRPCGITGRDAADEGRRFGR